MLKKMMLLAMAAAALIAFAAPSMASADQWTTNGTPVGESAEEGDAVHFTGTLASTKSGLRITCSATANTTLWNSGVGVGVATLTLSGPCAVAAFNGTEYKTLPGCTVNPSSGGENWPLSTSGSAVAIEEANFLNEFNGCAALGIPNGFKAGDEGTATGVVVGECITFSNEGDFVGGTKVDGELCPTTTGLELD